MLIIKLLMPQKFRCAYIKSFLKFCTQSKSGFLLLRGHHVCSKIPIDCYSECNLIEPVYMRTMHCRGPAPFYLTFSVYSKMISFSQEWRNSIHVPTLNHFHSSPELTGNCMMNRNIFPVISRGNF